MNNRTKYVVRSLRHKKIEFVKILGGKCPKCGYHKNIAALEFHHPNGKAKGMENWRSPKFKVEDCILLCSNHHREEEFPQLNDYQDETNVGLSKKILKGLEKSRVLSTLPSLE